MHAGKNWIASILAGVVIVPPIVLAHELGHIVGYLAFGFDGPTLHYSYSGFTGEPTFWTLVREGRLDAAGQIAGVAKAGWSALFGLLMSDGLAAVGLWQLARSGAVAWWSVAVSAAMRFPPVLFLFALGRSIHTDEAHVAQTLGIPEVVLAAIGFAVCIAAVIGGATILVRRGQGGVVAPGLAGVILGTALWIGFIGPRVLP